jgi:hypothetical protein
MARLRASGLDVYGMAARRVACAARDARAVVECREWNSLVRGATALAVALNASIVKFITGQKFGQPFGEIRPGHRRIGLSKDANGHPIFRAERTNVTIQDVIAAEGPRLPDVDHSQKRFNTGIVVVVEHVQTPGQELCVT